MKRFTPALLAVCLCSLSASTFAAD
ncbi:hypothetical protein, partial [Pantoea sp.]